MNKSSVELLSPAGSYEILKAVISAGADAVYFGGDKFSARAYATNFDRDNTLRAIDLGHFYGKKVIMAVNTLLKSKEIEEELYDYLLPYYEEGLDAVIVQDFGVLSFIREHFPDLPVHASTQMALCSEYGVSFFKDLGLKRTVLARELSLEEISRIHKNIPDIELETFVHGALCYSYSGQCLLSSMLGGRSGNRGRCAGPCRLNYQVYENGTRINRPNEEFPLSLKDLNTIDLLPQLIEAGVMSFKLEGRMKSVDYAAGTVKLYRKYIDRYFDYGAKDYIVSDSDKKYLFDLGNRCGFTQGYYVQKNGRDMVTMTRPNHTKSDDNETTYSLSKINVEASVTVKKNEPITVELLSDSSYASAIGSVPSEAKNRAADKESITDKVVKAGEEFFNIENINIDLDEGLFVNASELKSLRREAFNIFKDNILAEYKRNSQKTPSYPVEKKGNGYGNIDEIAKYASVETLEQLQAVVECDMFARIYADPFLYNGNEYTKLNRLYDIARSNGTNIYITLPYNFRKHNVNQVENMVNSYGFDGYLVRSYDGAEYLKRKGVSNEDIVMDHSIYTFSNVTVDSLSRLGYLNTTIPYELNYNEILHRNNENSELIAYGFIPLMISAQCINKSLNKCDMKPHVMNLKDRYDIMFKVKNNCSFCYNVLYNSKALNLFDEPAKVCNTSPAALRICFTVETKEEVTNILRSLKSGLKLVNNEGFTYGHFKRGVE